MLDIAALVKFMPVAGFVLVAAIGYGQIQADIKNITETQKQQFTLIQAQLQQISDRLNNGK